MTDAHSHRFALHLPGLLKVLAEHLYSSKKVGLRELIQNAHDSCTRRKLEISERGYRPSIRIRRNPEARQLFISDNGSGMTRDEIFTYLATIGRGYTAELRERLAVFSSEEAAELIGQFGLGFLSAFLLGSEVEVVTQSMQPGHAALRWVCSGDENFSLEPGQRDDIGTTVRLTLKPAAEFLLDEDALERTVRQYADFLPVPIYLDDSTTPANLGQAPWEAADPKAAIHEFIQRAFGLISETSEPLAVIPLTDWALPAGHNRTDTITVPMRGFLFIPPASVASLREYGDMAVYIRRMFITGNERDLLPAWARFVRGVIDSPALQPTASREALHQDEAYERVRAAVEQQLARGLKSIAAESPTTWRQIVRGHSELIIAWAVKNNEFFDQVAELVTLRTSRGPLTLDEYLKHTGGTLYYMTREIGLLQDQVLAEGRDVPAIDASWAVTPPFLEKYAARRPELNLVQLDGDAESLFRPVPESTLKPLLEFFKSRMLRVKAVTFKPIDVPAVVLFPRGAETVKEAGAALEAGEIPPALAGLVEDYLQEMAPSSDEMNGTLFLNANNALIRRLAAEWGPAGSASRAKAEALAVVVWQVARVFAGRMLTAKDAIAAFGDITRNLSTLA